VGAKMRHRSPVSLREKHLLELLAFVVVFSVLGPSIAHGSVIAGTTISYVGGSALSSYGTAVSSISINLPSGVHTGDCLIAQVIDYDGTGWDVPSPPAGWSVIRHDSASNINQVSSWLYYKIAGANEPNSYAWQLGTNWGAGAMGAWRGVAPSPIDSATGTTAIGNTPVSAAAPISHPKSSNEVRLYFYSSQGSGAPAISLPVAVNQRMNAGASQEGFALAFGDLPASVVTSGAGSENGGAVITAQSILVAPAQTSGSTPTTAPTQAPTVAPTIAPTQARTPTPTTAPTPTLGPSSTPSAAPSSTASGIKFIGAGPLSDYNSTVNSVSINLPVGIKAGDCLLAQLVIYDPDASDVPALPKGWTNIRHDSIYNGDQITSWLFYKIASSSEPRSYSWNIGTNWAAGVMGAWRGVTIVPIDSSSGATASGGSPVSGAAPSLTPNYDNELQVYFYGSQGSSGPTLALPPAVTQRSNTKSSKEGFTLGFGDSSAPPAGTASVTGPAIESGGGVLTAQALLLIPAGAPTPVPSATPTITAAPTQAPTAAPSNTPFAPPPTPTFSASPTAVATPPMTSTATPAATPTAGPVVKLLSPQAASTNSGMVQIVAQVAPSVNSINLYVDNNLAAQSAPYTYNWNSATVANGAHVLSAEAFSANDVMLGTDAININVSNGTATRSATPTPGATSTPTASPTPITDPLRPSNNIPNTRVPTAAELAAFHAGAGACGSLDDCSYMQEVDGQFTGTTAQIIQRVSAKWCPNCTILNPYDNQTYSFTDLLQAVAVNETYWHQWRTASLSLPDPVTGLTILTPSHGDTEYVTLSDPFGGSWGLFQIAQGNGQGWPASFPLSAISTGFNSDFKVAEQMGVEQGHLAYLNDPGRPQIAIANGYSPYSNFIDSNGVLHAASSDINQRRWGAVGNWYSGGWYDSGAIQYIQQVQQILHAQPWIEAGF
jgi:hypothetical protein